MNASYKIVLLGAFVLFAAVIGYYMLSGPAEPAGDDAGAAIASNDPQPADEPGAEDPTPEPERVAPTPPVRPAPVEPTPEVTIGPTEWTDVIDELGTGTPEETPETEPGSEPREGPGSAPGIILSDSGTDRPPLFGTAGRPGPGTADPVEPEPETEPEEVTPEPEPEPEPPRRETGPTPRTYTVQAGDTFASIALQIYGEERAWFEIAQANPSVDPKRLQVGQVISLPNLADTEREPEETTPPAPGQDQTYTVRPGDNLSRIAKRFYGDTEKWDLIYARNREKIGQRPDRLKVGMKLIIPQPYNGAE